MVLILLSLCLGLIYISFSSVSIFVESVEIISEEAYIYEIVIFIFRIMVVVLWCGTLIANTRLLLKPEGSPINRFAHAANIATILSLAWLSSFYIVGLRFPGDYISLISISIVSASYLTLVFSAWHHRNASGRPQ